MHRVQCQPRLVLVGLVGDLRYGMLLLREGVVVNIGNSCRSHGIITRRGIVLTLIYHALGRTDDLAILARRLLLSHRGWLATSGHLLSVSQIERLVLQLFVLLLLSLQLLASLEAGPTLLTDSTSVSLSPLLCSVGSGL